ncbi:MAG: T9SS type A sorting domain-containing protein [Bacteroidia bacterium]|nr:T9SS type A sorting domain-containing protein [Bacteroidia bacterium]MDW8347424.1 T9SS type A sorting domain-containing protein [Bacteroidia bacterium]
MKKIYLLFLLGLAVIHSKAQDLFFVNGATVTVQSGANVWIFGGLLATGTSSQITNNGNIYVEANTGGGNWTNNAGPGLLSGTGTVIIGADINQNIGGTFPTTFFNLTLKSSTVAGSSVGVVADNAAVTQKIMNQHIYVGANSDATDLINPPTILTGVLNLNNEILNTQTFVCSVVNPATTAITRTGAVIAPFSNATNEGMVISAGTGRLARNTSLAGTYFFPVGSLTGTPRFRPVQMITPAAVPNKGYLIRMENSNPSLLGTTLDSDPGEELFSINPAYYHIINHTLAGADNVTMRIHHDFTADNVCDANHVTISNFDGAIWQNQTPTISTTVNASPTLSWTQDSPYSGSYVTENFALAGWWNNVPIFDGTPACTFPVTEIKLTAQGKENYIALNWTTNVEANVKGFYLERSDDNGASFNTVTYQNSLGNSSSPRHYAHDDNSVIKNHTYFYRVKQVNKDGGVMYSNIAQAILLDGSNLSWGIEIYPNPISNQAQVVFNLSEDNNIKLSVYNAIGQAIINETYLLKAGSHTININTSSLSKGAYNWVFTDAKGNILSHKITKIDE